MAYSIAQRTHEIGVRMALGADRDRVRGMILREGLVKGFAGVGLGLFASYFLVRLLAGLLFGVLPRDPVIFVAAPVLLLAVTYAAAWIPARRAARLNPVQALRFE
jgi:ABC-type antimicrobial peptide transport system permease subunit